MLENRAMKKRKKRRRRNNYARHFGVWIDRVLSVATRKERKALAALAAEAFWGLFAKDRSVALDRLFKEGDRILYAAIFKDMRPTDNWALNVVPGKISGFTEVEHTLDRFRKVFPNTAKAWA